MGIQDWVSNQAIKVLLASKSQPGSIRRTLSQRRYSRAAIPSPDAVVVGVVQMQVELLDDGVAFANRYFDLVRQAVERGAQLVVFPEYAWLPILGLLPPVREIVDKGIPLQQAIDELSSGAGLTAEGILRILAPAVQRIFEATASDLAARFGIYLMPGSAMIADGRGRLFDTAYLFGPDGKLIGTQHKLHPTLLEVDWMTIGSSLGVFELPFGKVAMPVCMDFTYWETTRAASLGGADILLGFVAEEKSNEFFMAMRGIASRIQESYCYGTRACSVARLLGLNLSGPSSVVAPLGAWDDETIFMAQTKTHDHEEVITAKLDLAHLRKWRAARPRDYNSALYRRYLSKAYSAYRARVAQEGKRMV